MMFRQLNSAGWARTYLIADEDAKEGVLVDPMWDNLESDLETISLLGLTLRAVIGTHTHADHISAGWEIAERTGCDFIMHHGTQTHGVSRLVSDGDTFALGPIVFTFHSAPGHTTDSMIVEIPGHLMTGDFLFNGSAGVGRDDLPGGSLEAHWNALQVLRRFDPDALIQSGHEPPGNEPQTLAWNRANNPALKAESLEDYSRWQRAEWERLGSVSKLEIALPANRTGTIPNDYR